MYIIFLIFLFKHLELLLFLFDCPRCRIANIQEKNHQYKFEQSYNRTTHLSSAFTFNFDVKLLIFYCVCPIVTPFS